MNRTEFKILVVEDDSDTLDLILEMLQKSGIQKLAWAENGEDALTKITASTPHLVICDWNMPKMSGIEVLKKIKTMPGVEQTSFLMVTAERKKEEVMKAISEGVSDYIVKPFKTEDLIKKVNAIIDQKMLGTLSH